MRKVVFLLCFQLVGSMLMGQDGRKIVNDNQFWGEVKLEKKITKNFELELSHSLRWDEDITSLSRSFTQLAASYDFTMWFNIKAGYRNAYFDTGYKRVFVVAGFDMDLKPFKIDINNRYEYNNERDEEEVDGSRLREKVSLKYANKKWLVEPSIFGELFLPFGNGYDFPEIDRVRFGFALEVSITKHHEISLGLALQDNYKNKKINRDMIYSVEYKIRL